jgi:hypothetical protein
MGLFVGDDSAHPDLWMDGAIDGFTSHLGRFGRSGIAVAILLNVSPNASLPIADVVAALKPEPAEAQEQQVR